MNSKRATQRRPAQNGKGAVQETPFKKFCKLHDTLATGILKGTGRDRLKRARAVAVAMERLFQPTGSGLREMVAANSAHVLSYMNGMGRDEVGRFREQMKLAVEALLEEDGIVRAKIYAKMGRKEPDEEKVERRKMEVLKYLGIAEERRAECHLINEMAALSRGGHKDYADLLTGPMEDGTFSVTAMLACMLDVAKNGIPNGLGETGALEYAKTIHVVMYPFTETLALDADTVEETRRVGMEKILEMEGRIGRFGTKELCEECERKLEAMLPFAQGVEAKLKRHLAGSRGRGGILADIERRKGMGLKLSSPTVDPAGVSRIKRLWGVIRKICERREKGEKGRNNAEYGFEDLPDIVACTCTVEGDLGDAKDVAEALIRRLTAKFGKKKVRRFEVDDMERPTGYRAAHLTFEVEEEINGEKMWVPIDIQVRPESVQKECLNTWSRGLKVGGGNITKRIVELVQRDIARITRSLSRRESMAPRNEVRLVKVKITDGGKERRRFASEQEIEIPRGGKVASVVGRIVTREEGQDMGMLGFSRNLSVSDGAGENLTLFDEVPDGGINVRITGGKGPDISVCRILYGKDLSDPAIKMVLGKRIDLLAEEKKNSGRNRGGRRRK